MRVRYYLKKQLKIDLKFENAKELFNLRYSQLRNVIKKIFDVFKRRFLSINFSIKFDILIQIQIQFGFITLYNFITLHHRVKDENIYIFEFSNNNSVNDVKFLKNNFTFDIKMNKFRNEIAIAM